MTLMTCCIHCRTVFRVTREQLQAHGGQVRCGRCLQVFNGLATLASPDNESIAAMSGVTESAAAAPAVVSEPPAPDQPLQADVPSTVTSVAAEAADALLPSPATSPESGAESKLELEPEPEPDSEPATVADPEPVPVIEAQLPAAADNPFVQDSAPAGSSRQRKPLLAAATVLLAVGLAAQAVFFYRGEVAAQHPVLRQWLTAACAQAGCTMPLPQRPKAVVIEASDLQIADPAVPGRIQLTATLRNHAEHEVAYPALDLVLTNVNDHTLARRVFMPAEYLEKDRNPRAGFAANAELTVRLALDTGHLGAAGFRLAVLAAPQR